MNQQQFDKYNILYNYLFNLEAKKFTLKSFIDGRPEDLGKRKPFCNTKGCLSGYLPIVFPTDWHFVDIIVPLLIKNSSGLYSKDMSVYLGLDEQEILQLTVAKNYNRPNLENVLGRMKLLGRTYGFSLRVDKYR